MKKTTKRVRQDQLEIDLEKGLVFDSESELLAYFQKPIAELEAEYESHRSVKDLSAAEEIEASDQLIELTLDDPDEVYEDADTISGLLLYIYVRKGVLNSVDVFNVAICHVADEVPTFVYLSFTTRLQSVLQHYRRGFLVYSRAMGETESVSLDGDALSEGDELAVGLCSAMLTVRSDRDLPIEAFVEYGELREQTIEDPDEIWKNTDLSGNVLVSFIKEFSDSELEDLHYVVVTQEEEDTKVHALLFSFPTIDLSLVDRYKHGENLHAEEVVQESSH